MPGSKENEKFGTTEVIEDGGTKRQFRGGTARVCYLSQDRYELLYSAKEEAKGIGNIGVIGDDPEFQWKDSFRSSRKSNEDRQLLLHSPILVLFVLIQLFSFIV